MNWRCWEPGGLLATRVARFFAKHLFFMQPMHFSVAFGTFNNNKKTHVVPGIFQTAVKGCLSNPLIGSNTTLAGGLLVGIDIPIGWSSIPTCVFFQSISHGTCTTYMDPNGRVKISKLII